MSTFVNKILLEANNSDYLKWKRKNVSLRGVKDQYNPEEPNYGVEGVMGNGLYTAALSNKAMARKYGTVVLFVVNAVPKKPLVVDTINRWEVWFQNNLLKPYNFDRREFSLHTDIRTEMLKLGYDGVIVTGREMVNYSPDNIRYFKDEYQVVSYFESLTN